jgi:hypothetical protein
MHYTTEKADRAISAAFDVAERVAALLDRRDGDAGDDPDVIEAIANRLHQIEREIVEAIGEPPAMARLPGGGLVHQSFLDIYKGAKP